MKQCYKKFDRFPSKGLRMLGAITGDIIGSPYEFTVNNIKTTDFPLFSGKSHFTDDTVMTVAVAEGIRRGYKHPEKTREEIIDSMHEWGQKFLRAGYGQKFFWWILRKNREPYGSYGNGAAMRVSPVAWAYQSLDEVERYAEISAAVTHNHPEGIKGAQAVASAIFKARTLCSKQEIRNYIQTRYGYNLERNLEEIRRNYVHDESSQKSVPEAITAFLLSDNFEDAIRKAVSLGGDSDTIAAITGSIAEAFYQGIPAEILKEVYYRLDIRLESAITEWKEWLSVQ